jgi:hypothetical protein
MYNRRSFGTLRPSSTALLVFRRSFAERTSTSPDELPIGAISRVKTRGNILIDRQISSNKTRSPQSRPKFLLIYRSQFYFRIRSIFRGVVFRRLAISGRCLQPAASLSGFQSLKPTASSALSDVSSTRYSIRIHPNNFRFIALPKGFGPPLPAVLS